MSNKSVSIINCGMGNIASVRNMVEHIGGQAQVISKPSDLRDASKIILPGVGAFDHGMHSLHSDTWVAELNAAVLDRKVPILGICLGMQLMCNSSDEGRELGLGWINAEVKRFDFGVNSASLKVPHMGWNVVDSYRHDPLVAAETVAERRYYFVHSYYVSCANDADVFLKCNYGHEFVAGFHHANIWGVQFHPEKSHKFGMELFKRFLEI